MKMTSNLKIHNLFKYYNPIIIFEGFDKVGKSSIISKLRIETGATSIHPSPFSSIEDGVTVLEEYERIWKMATIDDNRGVLIDRFIGSEFAYGQYNCQSTIGKLGKAKRYELFGDLLFTRHAWNAVLNKIITYPYTFLFLITCPYTLYLDREDECPRTLEFFDFVNQKYDEFATIFRYVTKGYTKFKQPVHIIENKRSDGGLKDFHKIFSIIMDELTFLYKSQKLFPNFEDLS